MIHVNTNTPGFSVE